MSCHDIVGNLVQLEEGVINQISNLQTRNDHPSPASENSKLTDMLLFGQSE